MKCIGSFFYRLLTQISLLVIVFAGTLTAQTTYYISSSQGNDSNNGTSEAAPWKSLSKLHSSWNQIVPGDKILLKRGDEWAPSSISWGDGVGIIRIPDWKDGTPDKYYTLGAYGNSSDPLPNLSGRNLGGAYHQVIRTGPLHYWKFRNLRFEGDFSMYPYWGDDQNPERAIHHVEIHDCEFDGRVGNPTRLTIFTGWQIYNHTQVPNPNDYANLGWYPAATHDFVVKGNKFWNSSGEDCINMVCVGDNIYVGYNEFYGSNEEFLDIAGGSGHVVEYNFASGTNAAAMKFHSQFSVLDGLIFRGNVLIKGAHEGLSNGAAVGFENVVNCEIYNNTFVGYNNGWAGWFGDMDRSGLYAYYGTFGGNKIKNNIFYGSVGVYGIWNNVTGTHNGPEGTFFTNNEISNNTYYLIPGNDLYYAIRIRKSNGSGGEHDVQIKMDQQHVFQNEWQNKASGGNTEKLANPGLANPYWTSAENFGDFSLASGSPSVNSGTTVPGYTSDINGVTVPQGSAPDRGAYEYGEGDFTAPRVESASLINATTVLINFSEPLSYANGQTVGNYSISNGVTVTEASLSGNQVTLTTSQHSAGNFTVTVNNVQDMAGNTITTNNTASYSYNPDSTPPELVSAQIENATTVVVNFNEAMQQSTAELVSNYAINNGVSVTGAVLTTPTKVTLTTSAHGNGSYTLSVSNLNDLAGNTISASSSANYSFNNDSNPPELVSADILNETTVEVNFNEEVDKTTAENASNYQVNGGSGIRVWIDGDTANEIDDLFAITDILMSPDFLVEGLSSAHYGLSGSSDVNNSQNLNEDILTEMGLLNSISHPLGAADKMVSETTPQNSAAAQEIVARANAGSSENKLLVLVFGPATNVASALLLDPTIEDKIIVGYMGCTYNSSNLLPNDFNANNDVNSFNSLMNTNVEIKIMPGTPISSQLSFAKTVAASKLNGKGGIWQYLYNYWVAHFNGYANRTMWDVCIVQAIKNPAYASHDIVTYRSRNDIWVYNDINESAMESDFWASVLAHQNGGPGCSTLNSGGTVNILSAVKSAPATVTLTTSSHSAGTYNLAVSNVNDLNSNTIAPNSSVSYSYTFDNVPPKVTSASILSATSVRVTFSERISNATAQSVSNYSINNGVTVSSATLSSSGNEVTLTTSTHGSGTFTLTVSNIQDLNGNTISSNNTAQYTFTTDTEAPEILEAEIMDATTVRVLFSEAINQTNGLDASNYSINRSISVSSVTLSTPAEVMLTTSEHSSGSYNLTVSNVTDLAGNTIAANSVVEYYFDLNPNGPQLIVTIASETNTVEAVFSEQLQEAGAEDIANYSISDEIQVQSAELNSSGTKVTLTVDDLTFGQTYTLTVNNVQDLNGNVIDPAANSNEFILNNKLFPVALYDFSRGVNSNKVYDISGNGVPLNLTISNPNGVNWLDGNGLSVNSNTTIISEGPATKIINGCKTNNAISIEAWIKPANNEQDGPARIVSIAKDPMSRNVTLGQGFGSSSDYGYDIRLRTTERTTNGLPSVTTSSPAVTTTLTHVVYIRRPDGQTQIFINGVESLSTNVGGSLTNWDDSFKLALANEITNDRPWLGELHKIAIYDYALNLEEVQLAHSGLLSTNKVNVKVFLEGPYSNGEMTTDLLDQNLIPLNQPYNEAPCLYEGPESVSSIPDDIVDWVLVEIRSTANQLASRRAAFLRKDGMVVDLNGISKVSFPDLAAGEYYVTIIHRNHLALMSAQKTMISTKSVQYDLTTQNNIYKEDANIGAVELAPNVFGLYAGDTNCSNIITFADVNSIIRNNTKSGYSVADVNLSGIVTFSDITHVVDNNTHATNVPNLQ